MYDNGRSTDSRNDYRVLIHLGKSRDAEAIPGVLAGVDVASVMCSTLEELCAEIGTGAGALLIEEEVVAAFSSGCLRVVLERQPSWSELPIIVLLRHGPETRAARDALLLPGDVTLLERPVRVNTLLSIIHSALRSRRRQYLVRDQLQALDESEAALKRSAAELEAAYRELEAFSYTVAHDLRKPLTVINGYTQILRELCGDVLDDQCKGYVEETYEGTLRMNRLIDALLEFSRLAHAEPKREPVDLSGMCEEVAAELKLAEPKRRVIFRIPSAIAGEGDADLLRVVLNNLLGNAWKYTSCREEGIIEFGSTEVDRKPAYFVRDNGIGFDRADTEKVFAPFQRLERGQEVGGLGIGLATVARVIQRHGGKVWAEGEPGKGATFYFTLGER